MKMDIFEPETTLKATDSDPRLQVLYTSPKLVGEVINLPCADSIAHLPDLSQLFVEALGGDGLGGAEFLGEGRDFELFDHPAKFLHSLARFACFGRRGLQLLPRILIRGDLAGTFLIFHRILSGALDPG